MPLFLAALLLVRGLPALLYRRFAGTPPGGGRGPAAGDHAHVRDRGRRRSGSPTGKITPTAAASLLAAGLLSAALFPGGAQRLLPRAATPEAADAEDTG